MGLSKNQQTFLTIFLAICGVVGVVLAVLNMNEAKTLALVFGIVGVVCLVAAVATRKKPEY